MKFSMQFPQVSGKRLAFTGVVCSSATTLWIGTQVMTFGTTPMLAAVGVAIPFGVGALTLSLLERRIAVDDQPAAFRQLPEHDQAVMSR